MADTYKFSRHIIMGWAIDNKEDLERICRQSRSGFNLENRINDYKQIYNAEIAPIIAEAGLKLNLGGAIEKQKIIITDRPTGIFDFGLAARGLYRLQEFYSEEIATKYPDKFAKYKLPLGIVPADFVNSRIVNGITEYTYVDDDGLFLLKRQQKGEQAVKDGMAGAKLEYATKTKKSFITFKRNRGRVKYLEIYSLFYFSRISGDVQFAIRHLPIIMLANYFESIGIKTRIYMTRFVQFTDENYNLIEVNNGVRLPMYDEWLKATGSTSGNRKLFVQPIIAKDFGEEIDMPFAFAMSNRITDGTGIYYHICRGAQMQEASGVMEITGDPNWSKEDYFVGFERYRNKYEEYVNKGVFKSKEVLPEAMIFFHDQIINLRISSFLSEIRRCIDFSAVERSSDSAILQVPLVNTFFSWWMRVSANVVKVRVNLINSIELGKELEELKIDMLALVNDYNETFVILAPAELRAAYLILRTWGQKLLQEYNMINRGLEPTFKSFIISIQSELTIYAEGNLYETPDERKDKLDDLSLRILEALNKMD